MGQARTEKGTWTPSPGPILEVPSGWCCHTPFLKEQLQSAVVPTCCSAEWLYSGARTKASGSVQEAKDLSPPLRCQS